MQRVRTESGSVYDVDRRGMRLRRVHGRHGPADSQPQDGIWRRIAGIDGPVIGEPMVVYWAKEVPGASHTDFGFRTTVVLEVSEVSDDEACEDGSGTPASSGAPAAGAATAGGGPEGQGAGRDDRREA